MIVNWVKTMLNYKVGYKSVRKKKAFEDINFPLLKVMSDRQGYQPGAIDDTTWHDLEMNKVFHRLNNTYTLSGEERLYKWLRRPCLNNHEYDKRKNRIEDISKHTEIYKEDLRKVGSFDYDYDKVLDQIKSKTSIDKKPMLLMLTALVSVVLFMLLNFSVFLFVTCSAILGVILYHYFYMASNKEVIDSIDYFIKMSVFVSKQAEVIGDVYKYEDLKAMFALAGKLSKYKHTFNRLEGIDALKDIMVALTLQNYVSSVAVLNLLYEYKDQAQMMIRCVGELDLVQSLGVSKGEFDLIEPSLYDARHNLNVVDSYNLLVKDCVKNDIDIDDSIVITGSNMGGKSTYLRQVGISIVMAQSLCITPARAYEGGFYTVVSSISLNDDIEDGKSYFMKEAEAIQRMLGCEKKSYNTLFLIDEIFKGTNPIERLASSVEILNHLTLDHQVIVTTHDIGILPYLDRYVYYHFEHYITKSVMAFDYKLKKGVTEVKNAIKLMEYINYPKDLIDSINCRMIEMNEVEKIQ